MNAHNLPAAFEAADFKVQDPGASGVLPHSRGFAVIPLVTAAAESRTLPAPVKPGQILTLQLKTDGGDCTVTVTGGYDETGGTSLVFSDSGEYVTLLSVETANGTYRWRVLSYDGVTGPTTTVDALSIGGTLLTATATELNRIADQSARTVTETTATLAVTVAAHDGKTIVLDRAGGIAVTLPDADAAAVGAKFRFIVKTTFTGAASIKSSRSADIMIGHAIMGNNSDNTVVNWQATAADTFDTIDLLGTSNSTGGMAGQVMEIECIAANTWFVKIVGDAAGTEATPFANTVAP